MKQIMIVEDNDDINTMLKDLLSQDYQIQQAFPGLRPSASLTKRTLTSSS